MDLNHHTGGTVDGWAHVVQSIETILSTRLNTRVFRREFGSDLPALIDAPLNEEMLLAVYVATAEAIETWEPRFEPTGVQLEAGADGVVTLVLSGIYRPNAHIGDATLASDSERTVRVESGLTDSWRQAA